MVYDADFMREAYVKNYHAFTNRRVIRIGGPLDVAVMNLKDDHWKYIRSALSPTFTQGKLKMVIIKKGHSANNAVQSGNCWHFADAKKSLSKQRTIRLIQHRFSLILILTNGRPLICEAENQGKIQNSGISQFQFVLIMQSSKIWRVILFSRSLQL